MPSDVTFVPSTQALAEEYFGGLPPYGFVGHVALLAGKPVGVGGIFRYCGLPVVFTQMRDEMRGRKKDLARAVRLMVDTMDKTGGPVYAVADPNEPTSVKLLAKLGFLPVGIPTDYGEFLVRNP